MKDFPIHELHTANDLESIRAAVVLIYSHMRKMRTTSYPAQRAIHLVEAISRDLNAQLLKVKGCEECVCKCVCALCVFKEGVCVYTCVWCTSFTDISVYVCCVMYCVCNVCKVYCVIYRCVCVCVCVCVFAGSWYQETDAGHTRRV